MKKHPFFTIQHKKQRSSHNQHDGAFFDDILSDIHPNDDQTQRHFLGRSITHQQYLTFFFLLSIAFLILLGRIFFLQVVKGETYSERAENNRTYVQTILPERGGIYDSRGIALAENEAHFALIAYKSQLPEDELYLYNTFTMLADMFSVTVEDVEDVYFSASASSDEVILIDDVSYDIAIQHIAEDDLPEGVAIEPIMTRQYITDKIPSLSHIIGYIAPLSEEEYEANTEKGYRAFDMIGKQGIEDVYEDTLLGTYGKTIYEVDAVGNIERVLENIEPEHGEDVHLHIDSSLHAYIEDVLTTRLETSVAEQASVIVMDAHTGAVYAAVSWPSFDANIFHAKDGGNTYAALLEDERNPLFPRAISGAFPSGSTIKPVFAAAALAEDVITPTTQFLSTGGLSVGLWFFPDWRAGGHGWTNVYHAIADSVNTFFYMIGGGYQEFDGLGIARLKSYAETFGFGSVTGADITGEAKGLIPDPAWKLETIGEQWYIGDTYNTSIGQGYFLATPLQIARATAVFANGGYLVTPHLAQSLTVESEPIIDPDIASIIRDAMRQTVTKGSATSLQAATVPVAGKTGTAQWSSQYNDHSWFTGFAPYDDPEIVVTVLVEQGGETGLAIPVARDVFNWWFAE